MKDLENENYLKSRDLENYLKNKVKKLFLKSKGMNLEGDTWPKGDHAKGDHVVWVLE